MNRTTEDYSDRNKWPDDELMELFVRAEQESRSASQYWVKLWKATHDEILRRMREPDISESSLFTRTFMGIKVLEVEGIKGAFLVSERELSAAVNRLLEPDNE